MHKTSTMETSGWLNHCTPQKKDMLLVGAPATVHICAKRFKKIRGLRDPGHTPFY